MPWIVHGSKEGYYDFTLSDTRDEAAGKFNAAATARRLLVHPLSELEVREVVVLERRSDEDKLIATLLHGERIGLLERVPGKPTVAYKAPTVTEGTCITCGRPKSFGSGKRCRECYSAQTAKNALWKKRDD